MRWLQWIGYGLEVGLGLWDKVGVHRNNESRFAVGWMIH